MAETASYEKIEKARVMLGLLESVERDGRQTQRRLASELGIALGLVNAYLKRCVKKGLVKVGSAPARRYAYYLTPQGFAEKSRLTVEYLAYSFSLFRRARSEYTEVLATARTRGFSRVVLAGISELAEIATICGLESGMQIIAIVDRNAAQTTFVGLPVLPSFDAVRDGEAVVLTALTNAADVFGDAVARLGADRILAPAFLNVGAYGNGTETAS